MSLISQINSLATRVATEFNTIRGLLIPYDDTTPPTTGQTLEFDGTNFVPATPAAGGGGGGGTTVEVSTLDTDYSLTNQATAQIIPGMAQITIPANRVVSVFACVRHNCDTATDAKFDIGVVSGNRLGSWTNDLDGTFSSGSTMGLGYTIAGSGGSTPRFAYISGYFTTSAETVVAPTWRQSTSGAGVSKIVAGSWVQFSYRT